MVMGKQMELKNCLNVNSDCTVAQKTCSQQIKNYSLCYMEQTVLYNLRKFKDIMGQTITDY